MPLDEAALLRQVRDPAAATSAGRAPAPAPTGPLTEADAIALAMTANPGLRAQRAGVAVAVADVLKARRLENPEIRIANGWQEDGGFGEDRFTMDLRWSPEPLPRHLAGIDAAKAAVSAREAEVADRTWDIRRQTRLAWTRAVFAGLRTAVEDRRAALRGAVLGRLDATPGVDPLARLRARVATSAAQDQARRRRDEEGAALQDLAKILGRASREGLAVAVGAEPPACEAPPPDPTPLVDAAGGRHPRVRTARAAYAIAEAELKVEYARRLPWARWVQVGWGYQPHVDKTVTTYRNQVRLGVSLDLPILDWNQGGVASGQARRGREAERFRGTLVEVVGDADDALRRWTAAHEALGRMQRETAPLADQAVAATAEAVRTGRLAELDLLKARLEALDVRESLLDAMRSCREAAIDAQSGIGD
jgi:outer membrane protein TolC